MEEFRALRATIRERGTARVAVAFATFGLWALLVVALLWMGAPLVATLVSLLLLAAGFESVFALHVGVERVGRYVEIRYEGDAPSGPAWERTLTAFGRSSGLGAMGIDPLFTGLFVVAVALNLLPAIVRVLPTSLASSPDTPELAVLAVVHGVSVLRIVKARRSALRQRQSDLDTFAAILRSRSAANGIQSVGVTDSTTSRHSDTPESNP